MSVHFFNKLICDDVMTICVKKYFKKALLGSALLMALFGVSACDQIGTTPKTAQPEMTTETAQTPQPPSPPEVPVIVRRPNVSQQFVGIDLVNVRLATILDEIPYQTNGLNDYAVAVNQATWHSNETMNEQTIIKIQALLNWHHHSVGAVDGKMSANTIKAMQVFQEANGLPKTESMDLATWQKLTQNSDLTSQPVLVRYELTAKDVRTGGGRSGYRSVSEAVAERFHMSQKLLKALNPDIPLKAGSVITVYNPHQPNEILVKKVVVQRNANILYAYDETDKLVASYPTTINRARTPKGTYKVTSRIIDPSYNSDFKSKKNIIAPGPNNPVGRVWIGISKPSFGIHGSPEPELISRQTSAGCVRLTNWDALGLLGAIEQGAVVEFV